MKKYIILTLSLFTLLSAKSALALCPVCTVAVAGGVGMSRWLGIDDSVTGLWVGALLMCLTMWTIDWLERKKWTFKFYKWVIGIAYYGITLFPLQYTNILGHPSNKLFGMDKLIMGTIIGSVIFWLMGNWYFHLKKKNNDRAHFPYQKIVMTVGAMIILSVVFYLITK